MLDSEMGDREEIEDRIIKTLGLRDYDHFKDFQLKASQGMQDHGDAFIVALGLALKYASDNDAIKIIRIWGNEVSSYELIHRCDEAKRKAEEEMKWTTL
jgi:hypothetical protein